MFKLGGLPFHIQVFFCLKLESCAKSRNLLCGVSQLPPPKTQVTEHTGEDWRVETEGLRGSATPNS